MTSYSAIIPCLNEEENIPEAYQRINDALTPYTDFEMIFIDDGSSDATLENIKEIAQRDARVKYISFSKNFGLEAAFRAGFKYAAKDWCIQFDADLQSPPEEVYKLIDKAQEGYDVVFGIRRGRKDSLTRRLGSKLQQLIAKHLFRINLPIGASVYRLVRTSVAKKIIRVPTSAPYFIATVPLVTRRYTTVETSHSRRRRGKSSWRIARLIAHSFDLFFGFSYIPLVFLWFLLLVGCLISLVIIATGIAGHDLSGFFPTGYFLSQLLILLACAILGEYLRRMIQIQLGVGKFIVLESNILISDEDSF